MSLPEVKIDALDAFAEALRSRRTVNFFTDQAVPADHISGAVELARWAPNHRLTEPWQFHHLGPVSRAQAIDLAVAAVAASKGDAAAEAKRKRMNDVPEWLVVNCRSDAEDELRDREDYAATCCAIQNLLLYLAQVGLGAKWTTGPVTRDPDLIELVGLDPTQCRVVGLIWIGWPRLVPESKRRDLSEIFQRLP